MQSRSSSHAVGVDVSHWQGDIDWNQVADADYTFAYMKATEGTAFIDDKFAQNVARAKEAGILIGAYHLLRAGTQNQAIEEANHFIGAIIDVGGINVFDLPPVVDVEDENNTPEAVRAWVERTKSVFDWQPVLYTYPAFIDEYLNDTLSDLPLWYANYNNDQPVDRGGWTEWMFLQFTESGTVPGIEGATDLDEFNGNVEDLSNLRNLRNLPQQPEYLLSPEDANKMIGFLSAAYGAVAVAEAQNEFHRLANELRKASGQPEE